MSFPIIDLHCDLLFYLEKLPQRTPYDLTSRCAIPQLKQGNVKLQVLAVFTQTDPCSLQRGEHQIDLYRQLALHYPKDVIPCSTHWNFTQSSPIATLLAIENASGFCTEGEPLAKGFERLYHLTIHAKPLYVSLTWNEENRFGGGAWTRIGLKEDGKHLLEKLHQYKIAVDLSHASDALAYDIIDYIEGHRLEIPLMASHSNARSIVSVPRNLPDEIAREIFRRGGVVGLNLCSQFIGGSEEFLLKHIAHWLELGGEEHIALGADFFYEEDLPAHLRQSKAPFFPNYQDASCYEKLLNFLHKELRLSPSILEKLAYKNAWNFISASF